MTQKPFPPYTRANLQINNRFPQIPPSKKRGVEVAVLRGPSWIKTLTSQFLASLRGPSRINVLQLQLQFFAALRGPSRPFVDKDVDVAVLSVSSRPFADKGVAVAVLRGPSWPFVERDVEVAVLRAPPWTKRPSLFPPNSQEPQLNLSPPYAMITQPPNHSHPARPAKRKADK